MTNALRALAVLAGLQLAACADEGFSEEPDPTGAPTSRSDVTTTSSTSLPTARPGRNRPLVQSFPGTGTALGRPGPPVSDPVTAGPDGDITLNFVNADVKEVVRAVLGDFLKLNYTIDGSVQGQVTMQTSQPMRREAVLPVLEETLRAQGLLLIAAGGTYRVTPASDAVRGPLSVAGAPASAQPGFGTIVVPLRYVSAAEMRRVLEPIAPARSALAADAARNVLLVSGTAQERKTLLDNIALFDVDYMAGMSFALFSPRFTDARSLARELGQVTGGRDGPVGRIVRFVPLDRLNAVLAISAQPAYLDRLRQWVERLDQPGDTVDRRIFVYRVQNGRAADIAGVLTKALGLGTQRRPPPAAAPPPIESEPVEPTPVAVSPGPGRGSIPGGPLPGSSIPGGPLPAPPPPPGPGYGPDPGLGVGGLGDINITADEPNNSLIIVAAPRDYATVESALRQLDVVPMQVLLEAVIAEVTLTNKLRFGVQYYFQSAGHQLGLTSGKSLNIAPTAPGFSYAFSSGNFRVVLDALSNITRVNVVSSPQVMVLNNQTAMLQVGDQVPIATQQAVSVTNPDAPLVNSIQYRDTGIILKVTPRVNQGGMVMVDVSQEVSDVAETTTSNLNSPTIKQRKISSAVAVRDGETIALGGLIRSGRTRARSGVPFLQDIPVLGILFRTTENADDKTELLILITPRVVDSSERARTVTDELRRRLPEAQSLVRGIEARGKRQQQPPQPH